MSLYFRNYTYKPDLSITGTPSYCGLSHYVPEDNSLDNSIEREREVRLM